MSKEQGIYKMFIGDYFYIGQSINIKQRIDHHKYYLKKGIHKNHLVRKAYAKNSNIRYEVILYCEKDELDYYEQKMLDIHIGNPYCLNITRHADPRGVPRSMEVRKRMVEGHKGKGFSILKFVWEHEDGRTYYGDATELAREYGLSSSSTQCVVRTYKDSSKITRYQHKGWGIEGWQDRKNLTKN